LISIFKVSPLSSWGGSFDDLVCGDGKICGDPWSPIPSRDGSVELNDLERRRRSMGTLRSAYREDYDDDIEVIRQQPLPMDVRSMRAPVDADYYPMPLLIRPRHSVPENNRTLAISEKPKKRRRKKRVTRSVKKRKPLRRKGPAAHLSGHTSSAHSVVRVHRIQPIPIRSSSEPRMIPPVYVRLHQNKRVIRAPR
ncbi:hypothetical protein COOONC_14826, partial [Cooperia oncophora]